MKRLFTFVSSFALFLLPFVVKAQDTGLIPCEGADCQTCHVIELGQNVITFLAGLAVSVATLMFAFAGIKYLTSRGKEGEISSAKNMMTNAVVGIVIIFASWVIVNTVMVFFLPNNGQIRDFSQGIDSSVYLPWNEITCIDQPEGDTTEDPDNPIITKEPTETAGCVGCVDLTATPYLLPVSSGTGTEAQETLADALNWFRLPVVENTSLSWHVSVASEPGLLPDTIEDCHTSGHCVDVSFTGASLDVLNDAFASEFSGTIGVTAINNIAAFIAFGIGAGMDVVFEVPSSPSFNFEAEVEDQLLGFLINYEETADISESEINAIVQNTGAETPHFKFYDVNYTPPGADDVIGGGIPFIDPPELEFGGTCNTEGPSGEGVLSGASTYSPGAFITYWTYFESAEYTGEACTWSCASGYVKDGNGCFPESDFICEEDPSTGEHIPEGAFISREDTYFAAGQNEVFDIVVIEAESGISGNSLGDWSVESDSSATGGQYIRWNGPDTFDSGAANDEIEYKIWIAKSGWYELRMRSRHDSADSATEGNDAWSLMSSATVDGHSGWIKTGHPSAQYGNGFTFHTLYEPVEGEFPSPVWNLSEGLHTFTIKGRSAGFEIDRFHFHTAEGTLADDTSYEESIQGLGDECSVVTIPPDTEPPDPDDNPPPIDVTPGEIPTVPDSYFTTATGDLTDDVGNNIFDQAVSDSGTIWVSTTGNDSNSCTSEGSPCKTIAAGLNKLTSGEAMIIRGGTYREMIDLDKSNVTILGYRGETAIINGADIISSSVWNQSTEGGNEHYVWDGYNADFWQHPSGYDTSTFYYVDRGHFFHESAPENVVIDDKPLIQVYNLSDLEQGTFYRKGSAGNPTSLHVRFPNDGAPGDFGKVEVAMRSVLFNTRPNLDSANSLTNGYVNGPDNVTVAGLRFKIGGNSGESDTTQDGIFSITGDNYRVDDLTVVLANASGVGIGGPGHHLTNIRTNYNGHKGFEINSMTGSIIEFSEAIGNNWKISDTRWAAGGAKITHSSNGNFLRDLYFKDNNAVGLWFDLSNTGNTIERVAIINNAVAGAFFEASSNNNTFRNSIIYGTRLDQNQKFTSQWDGIGLKTAGTKDNTFEDLTIYGNEGTGYELKAKDNRNTNDGHLLTNSILVNNTIDSALQDQEDYELAVLCDDAAESFLSSYSNLTVEDHSGDAPDYTFGICDDHGSETRTNDVNVWNSNTSSGGIDVVGEASNAVSDPNSPTGYTSLISGRGANFTFTYR